jgi:hypothetical protein
MWLFHRHQPAFASRVCVVGINVDGINDDSLRDSAAVRSFVDKERLPSYPDRNRMAGVYTSSIGTCLTVAGISIFRRPSSSIRTA